MKKNLLFYILIFLSFLLISRSCQQTQTTDTELTRDDLGIMTTKTSYSRGKEILVNLQNNTGNSMVIENRCPEEPLDVFYYQNGQWIQKEKIAEIDCEEVKDYILEPGQKIKLSYSSWTYALFSDLGRYQIQTTLKIGEEEKTFSSNEFTLEKENALGLFWLHGFYRPIYNTLIFFTRIIPGHDLGLAIILLTILIRTILLVPSQKALKSQKRLQEIQPKLEAVKKKYAGNQQRIAQETMQLWKEHKVNPFGSCLPLVLQFPVLIALFYVIKDGLNPDKIHLLYEPLRDFSLSEIQVVFLGLLDLTKINIFVLPLIVGGLQFLQMKLALSRKKAKETLPAGEAGLPGRGLSIEQKSEKEKKSPSEFAMANKMMIYFMPVMIAFFTASLPTGVGFYWGISTLYGIGQQIVVNRQTDQDSKVRVINK